MMASAVNPAGLGCGLCANEALAISRIAPKRNTDIGIDRALRRYLQDDSEVPDSPRFASVAPFSKSPSAKPIATGWSEPVPGRELHPLKSSAFSRRTLTPTTVGKTRKATLRSTFVYWLGGLGGSGTSMVLGYAGSGGSNCGLSLRSGI